MIKEKFIYGLHSVLEGIESDILFDKIFFRKGIDGDIARKIKKIARLKLIPVQEVPIEKLNRITRKTHQGCIGIISPIEYNSLEQLIPTIYEKGESPLLVVLDGITDTRNFGAIARTSECAGVHAVIIPTHGSVSVTADAVNASAGALMHIPICRVRDLVHALRFMSNCGIKIVIADEKSKKHYFESSLEGPVAIVMGNEHIGVSDKVRREASMAVSIPLKGRIKSLNVSVATGILLFDIVRRRIKNNL